MKHLVKIIVGFAVIMLSFAANVYAGSGEYLVKFKEGFCPDIVKYDLSPVNAERGIYSATDIDFLKPVENYIEFTSQNREVSLIEGQEPLAPFAMPKDQLYSQQWHLDLINASAGWDIETYGNDIKVAVIDSGCIMHEDLKNNLLEGKNYIDGTTDVTDNKGHGTHVSGIIAAEMNDIGIAGIAPKAKIVPLKCFDPSQSTYVNDILDAIYDAVDIYDCKIINMSWGLSFNDPFLKEAINYAYSKGVILVAAVGNYGTSQIYYPAGYENVIGVGSVNRNKEKSSFSQFNKSVTVVASGESVKSTYNDGKYRNVSGTSQATPMVAGIAAVALSLNIKLSNADFKQLLTETTEDLGTAGYDVNFGYGLVNEGALIKRLMQNIDYYVSPINQEAGEAYVLVKNNTGRNLKAVSIFSKYNNDSFVNLNVTDVELNPNGEMVLRTASNNNNVSHFLWNNFNNLLPVAEKR